jgi:hypothetical protein
MVSAFIPTLVMFAGWFLWISAFVLAAILVHEAGHILGGLLCGFRITTVKVGPIRCCLTRPIQCTWHWNRFFPGRVGGQFRKMPGPWAVMQCFGFLIAGSFINICIALLVLPLAVRDTVAANVFAFFILTSMFFGVAQLIPFEAKEMRSDGAKIMSLLFDKAKRSDMIFLLSLRARVDEVRKLIAGHRVQEAIGKIEELIDGYERIPALKEGLQGTEKLCKLRDTLQQYLSGAATSPPEAHQAPTTPPVPSSPAR